MAMGKRRAFVCLNKECIQKGGGVMKRVFATPEDPPDYHPSCHGRMTVQPNVKYMGKRVK